jgi:excisionase family DNA binding protein
MKRVLDSYITPERVAALLQIERAVVERWIDARVLHAVELPDGRRRILRQSLRTFLTVHAIGFRPGRVNRAPSPDAAVPGPPNTGRSEPVRPERPHKENTRDSAARTA